MSETIEYWLKAVEAKKSELEALRPLSESAVYRLREELKVLPHLRLQCYRRLSVNP